MLINLSELIKNKLVQKTINMEFTKEKFFDGSDYVDFSKPVVISGAFTRKNEIIMFEGELSTELILTCSRCLDKFNYVFECPLDIKFSLEKGLGDEYIIVQSDSVDFDPIVESAIVFELPIKKLCKEDCKGICPYCGNNLNNHSCNCKKDSQNGDLEDNDEKGIDPRFAKLKDLFKNN